LDPEAAEGRVMEGVVAPLLGAAAVWCALSSARAVATGDVTLPEPVELPTGLPRGVGNARRVLAWLGRRGWVGRIGGLKTAGADGSREMSLGGAVIGAMGMAILLIAGPWPGPICAPVAFILVIRLPRLADVRASRRRAGAIDAALPQFLDALAAASTAGLSASLGIRRATAVVNGPLRDELSAMLRAVDLGARWRDELRAMADRSDVTDLRRAVGVITRTETLGSSLASSTVELADRVRENRRQRLMERARTAPVRMLFPLVFLVLPAFLLLTVVPVLLTTLLSIH